MTYHTFSDIYEVDPITERIKWPKKLKVFASVDAVNMQPIDKAPEGATIEHHDIPTVYR